MGRLLVEVVLDFGINGEEWKGHQKFGVKEYLFEKTRFFCGINSPLNVGHFAITIYGPTSTTDKREVAMNFATENGIILKVSNEGFESRLQCFFICSVISDFIEESERLWMAGRHPLRIVYILIVRSSKNYERMIHALYTFDLMISSVFVDGNAVEVTRKDYKVIRQLIDMKLKGGDMANMKDVYLSKEWDLFLRNKKKIELDLDQINDYFTAISNIVFYKVAPVGGTAGMVSNDNVNVLRSDWLTIFPTLESVKIMTEGRLYRFSLEALVNSLESLKRNFTISFVDRGEWIRNALSTDIKWKFAKIGWAADYRKSLIIRRDDTLCCKMNMAALALDAFDTKLSGKEHVGDTIFETDNSVFGTNLISDLLSFKLKPNGNESLDIDPLVQNQWETMLAQRTKLTLNLRFQESAFDVFLNMAFFKVTKLNKNQVIHGKMDNVLRTEWLALFPALRIVELCTEGDQFRFDWLQFFKSIEDIQTVMEIHVLDDGAWTSDVLAANIQLAAEEAGCIAYRNQGKGAVILVNYARTLSLFEDFIDAIPQKYRSNTGAVNHQSMILQMMNNKINDSPSATEHQSKLNILFRRKAQITFNLELLNEEYQWLKPLVMIDMNRIADEDSKDESEVTEYTQLNPKLLSLFCNLKMVSIWTHGDLYRISLKGLVEALRFISQSLTVVLYDEGKWLKVALTASLCWDFAEIGYSVGYDQNALKLMISRNPQNVPRSRLEWTPNMLKVFESMITRKLRPKEVNLKDAALSKKVISFLIESKLRGNNKSLIEMDKSLLKQWDLLIESIEEIYLKLWWLERDFKIHSELVMFKVLKHEEHEVVTGNDNVLRTRWLSIFPSLHTLTVHTAAGWFKFQMKALLKVMDSVPHSVTIIVVDSGRTLWIKGEMTEEVLAQFAEKGWNLEYKWKQKKLVIKYKEESV